MLLAVSDPQMPVKPRITYAMIPLGAIQQSTLFRRENDFPYHRATNRLFAALSSSTVFD